MRVWEEGKDRAERMELREAEDREVHRLYEQDRMDRAKGGAGGRLLTFTRAQNAYRESLKKPREPARRGAR